MTEKEARDTIERLAKSVFDYDYWDIRISTTSGEVYLTPSSRHGEQHRWPSVQECIDDLKARRLVRFTNLSQYMG